MCEYFYDGDTPVSDLACERRRADVDAEGVSYSKEFSFGGVWERIRITSEAGARSIGRPIGSYDTLTVSRMDLLDPDEIYDASEEVARELCLLVEESDVIPERILVVGLGSRDLTPDSIGPKCAEQVFATMHVKKRDSASFSSLDCSEIAVIKPGVTAESGMDAASVVRCVCEASQPSVVIAIDALASGSVQRLGRTVQISDTGIFPGAGLGNPSGAITKETVGAPVIAIGVPTVIDARLLSDDRRIPKDEALFVSPKEINGIVNAAAKIIGGGINQAFGIA